MSRTAFDDEIPLSYRSSWLRAAVLGANDGILSVSSVLLGVAASGASSDAIITAGGAGLVAGASSMAAGEYVSVSSQRDTELADIRLEQRELDDEPGGEMRELVGIYEAVALPLIAVHVAPAGVRSIACIVVTLLALTLLGSVGARLGGAPRLRATARVLTWGIVAMAVTAGIGALVGTAI